MAWYKVEYSSNNSGGSWWLSDDDWKALEEAGWDVNWEAESEYRQTYSPGTTRWLEALATRASKLIEAPSEEYAEKVAIAEWEAITNEYADDGGCPCCGPPHYFYTDLTDPPENATGDALYTAIKDALDAGYSVNDIETIAEEIAYS